MAPAALRLIVLTAPCPKCGGRMAEGFVSDNTSRVTMVSSWVEGRPQKSFWTGLKIKGRAVHAITTWRCGRCGFLEQYATG